MEKASFRAQVGRNQLLGIYVYPLLSVELYQLSEQREEIGIGRAVGIQMF